MIQAIRLFTGEDGQSHVEHILLPLDIWKSATEIRFQESPPGSALDWHTAPARQYVITLEGILEFITREGETFTLKPGDVLLAEDTAGGGHRWRLINDQPWKRIYVKIPS